MLQITHPRMESTPTPVDQGALGSRMTDDSHRANVIPPRIRAVRLIDSLKSDLQLQFQHSGCSFGGKGALKAGC